MPQESHKTLQAETALGFHAPSGRKPASVPCYKRALIQVGERLVIESTCTICDLGSVSVWIKCGENEKAAHATAAFSSNCVVLSLANAGHGDFPFSLLIAVFAFSGMSVALRSRSLIRVLAYKRHPHGEQSNDVCSGHDDSHVALPPTFKHDSKEDR